MLWRASRESIQGSVVSAMDLVNSKGFESVAFPVVGAGSGGFDELAAMNLMSEALQSCMSSARVVLVRYRPGAVP